MSGNGAETIGKGDRDSFMICAGGKMDKEMTQNRICAPPLAAENDTETGDRIAIYFTFDGQVDTYLLRKDLLKPIIKIFHFYSCKIPRNELFVKPREK